MAITGPESPSIQSSRIIRGAEPASSPGAVHLPAPTDSLESAGSKGALATTSKICKQITDALIAVDKELELAGLPKLNDWEKQQFANEILNDPDFSNVVTARNEVVHMRGQAAEVVKKASGTSTLGRLAAQAGSLGLKGLGMVFAGIGYLGAGVTSLLKPFSYVSALIGVPVGAAIGTVVGAFRDIGNAIYGAVKGNDPADRKLYQSLHTGDGIGRGWQVGRAAPLAPTTLFSATFFELAKGLSKASNWLLEKGGLDPETGTRLQKMVKYSPLQEFNKSVNG